VCSQPGHVLTHYPVGWFLAIKNLVTAHRLYASPRINEASLFLVGSHDVSTIYFFLCTSPVVSSVEPQDIGLRHPASGSSDKI
jgi:hypothetical protein